MRNRTLALLVLTGLSFALVPVGAGTAFASGRPLSATLTGAAEAAAPGDPDGSGRVLIRLNQGRGRVCFEFAWRDIGPPFVAHIHEGPPGAVGFPVVFLFGPGSQIAQPTRSGCVHAVARELIKEIRQHPGDYYVNVHTPEFPTGAIRGQLQKAR